MKVNENLIRRFNSLKNAIDDNKPEIYIGLGIAAFAGALFFTAKGTITASESISSAKDELEELERIGDDDDIESQHAIKLGCAGEVAAAYTPAVICSAASIVAFLGANHIMRQRVVGLAAAYTSISESFKHYRSQVVDEYGEDIDRKFAYAISKKQVKTKEIDPETGKKVKKTETVEEIGDSPFHIWFKSQYEVKKTGKVIKNLNFQEDDLYNITFLEAQREWFNNKISRGERVYINEILNALGIPEDDLPDSRVLGWIPKVEGGDDNYIRFNAYKPKDSTDYLINDDHEILIEFNADGVILYK